MAMPDDIAAILKDLRYDPETGKFYRTADNGSWKAGEIRMVPSGRGYLSFRRAGKLYLAHRIAFLCMTGEWPPEQVDHINGVKTDNRWCNLRPATGSQNQANLAGGGIFPNGLHRSHAIAKPWRAQIRHGKRRIHLGYFATVEEANAAYRKAAEQLRGEWAAHRSRDQQRAE
jgi:hypothetical protein